MKATFAACNGFALKTRMKPFALMTSVVVVVDCVDDGTELTQGRFAQFEPIALMTSWDWCTYCASD